MAIQRRNAAPPAPPAPPTPLAPPPAPVAPMPMPIAAPIAAPQVQYGMATVGVVEGPNFMDLGFYTGGFLIPQGHYVITDASVVMFKSEKGNDPSRLGVMITFVPLADPRQESQKTQFYSMGSQADKSYMPNPAHGKGIVPIAGAPSVSLNNSSNWFVFLKSMYDCGLSHNLAPNRVDIIEGTWVYIAHMDEPSERSSFNSPTSEVAQAPRQPRKIAVVGEIMEGGKPWEGTGGWPDQPKHFAVPAPVAPPPAAHINGAPAVPVAPQMAMQQAPQQPVRSPFAAAAAVPPPAPPAMPGMDAADLRAAAINGIGDILEASAKQGQMAVSRLAVRNGLFNLITSKSGEAVATAVVTQAFDNPAMRTSILGDLGCREDGQMIVAA